jgi:4-amino-4-deoxy-L-arabinose transferase-like glycosyltransferase
MEQRRWLALLVPLLLAAVLFLPGIGQRIIYIGDEARYALLARTMVETGDWLVPRLGDEVHMEKSPLFIWAIAALSLAGRRVTELTAVLPAALSGIGGVGMTYVLGRRMFGLRAGFLAALILATTWSYYWHARLALADMMVTFFVVAGAAAFWGAIAGDHERRAPMAIFWACLGLGFSAKGPVGFMPLLPFAAFLIREHGWRGLSKLRPLMGVAIVALIAAPWALAFALQREESYVQSVLIGDFLAPRLRAWDRFSELFFALGPIGIGFLPWTPFLPAAVRDGWGRAERDDVRRAFRFLGYWVLAYVIVITLLPHKRDRYLLPTFPPLALMVGWLWSRWALPPSPRALRVHGFVWGAVAAVLAVVVVLPLRARPEVMALLPSTLVGKLVLVGLLLASAILSVVTVCAGRALATFAAVCVPMAVVLAYESHAFVTRHNEVFDIKSFAQRLTTRVASHDALVTYRYQNLALAFYASRTVARVQDPGEIRKLLSDGRPVYVIVDDRGWRDMVEASGRSWTVLDQAPVAGRTLLLATTTVRP